MTCERPEHSCLNCPTRQTSEWSSLNDEELRLVDEAKKSRSWEPGQVLFHQGDICEGLFCIQTGLIGLRRVDENGNSALIKLCRPGGTIGYRALLNKTDHQNTAEVLSPSVICFIDRSTVQRLLSKNIRLGERFLKHGIEDLSTIEDAYVRSMTLSVKTRFLHALMVLYETHGYEEASGKCVLEIPIPRKDLAALIGTSPESISRIIRRLEAKGVMHFQDRRVSFPNRDVIFKQMDLVN